MNYWVGIDFDNTKDEENLVGYIEDCTLPDCIDIFKFEDE